MRTPGSLFSIVISTVAFGLAGVAVSASGSDPGPSVPALMKLAAETTAPPLSWRGTWSPDAQYAPGEVVSRDGSSYVATAPSTAAAPAASPASWELMAAKGETGATGATGAAGPQGPAGATGAASKLPISNTVAFLLPKLNVTTRNQVGKDILLNVEGAVVSDPGENGHLYLEVAPAKADGTPGTFLKVAYVACRNTAASTGQIACGGTLTSMVPVGGYYRLTLVTAAGYKTPDFVYDSGYGTFVSFG